MDPRESGWNAANVLFASAGLSPHLYTPTADSPSNSSQSQYQLLGMSAQHISSPPLDGSIPVLPGFVDFHAKHNPHLPWAVYPSGLSRASISFREYADATHRVAHAFRPDKTHANGKVVAVIIHTDNVLYLAILAGLVRAGYTVGLSQKFCHRMFTHLLPLSSRSLWRHDAP